MCGNGMTTAGTKGLKSIVDFIIIIDWLLFIEVKISIIGCRRHVDIFENRN